MNVFLFSGQGSQVPDMGLPFWMESRVYREWMRRLDAQCARELGAGPLATLYREAGAQADLGEIRWSHPALFMVQFAAAQAAMAEGLQPDLVLGASLGEYVALAAALDGADAAQAVFGTLLAQVRILETHCEPGGMLVVFGSSDVYARNQVLRRTCTLVSDCPPGHFVLAGSRAGLAEAVRALDAEGRLTSRLPVPYGFHSDNVEAARAPFLAHLEGWGRKVLNLACLSCLHGRRMSTLEPAHLWDIVRGPLRVEETLRELERSGPHRYFDFSPSGTLTYLGRRVLGGASESKFLPVFASCRDGLDSLGAWSSAVGPMRAGKVAAC